MSEQPDNERLKPEHSARPEPAEPAKGHAPSDKRLTIVGLGASAGGLAALQGFFNALSNAGQSGADQDGPPKTGLAFVVVTHMDPERESLLPEILQKHTWMPVRQVQEQTPIEPDHVYVLPPGRRILITDTHLDTEELDQPRSRRAPIDFFFRSLAKMHRQAVAVILSGGGTDGAVGVKAIKEVGGLLMVQDPAEAEHDSMPRAAIATGLADVVLPVAGLAQKLVDYHRNGVQVPEEPESLSERDLNTLFRILTQVQVHTGHDFSQYKRSTLLRRVHRRMNIIGHQTLDGYVTYLRHDSSEARALFNDLLIGVTNFFRDKESWEALAGQVAPHLFEAKEPGDTVRVWSIGCATGEEAYSLAITLLEQRDRLMAAQEQHLAGRIKIQIFASDLDDAALGRAREGIYPEAIEADVSPERLNRFFIKEGNYYQVKQEVRDTVLFSNHSVLRDPPFSRLDLISCRNLLIYLERELQDNVFQIFHYALRPEGYLFLGSAESAEMVSELFYTLDKHHRLYRARLRESRYPAVPRLPLALDAVDRRRHRLAQEAGLSVGEARVGVTTELHHRLLEEAAPPSLVVDKEYQILNFSETVARYLLHPAGPPTNDLLTRVRPELQLELRLALFRAFESGEPVVTAPVFVQFNGTPRPVTVAVHPRLPLEDDNEAGEPLALVFFLENKGGGREAEAEAAAPAAVGNGQRAAMLAQLEAENHRLRERLQSTTEEYESSNEELKAANEELQSMNEEYRSTTEELETSKEELQSVNEELQTVNAQLSSKLEEVGRAHGDLENLLAVTNVATLFLDLELRIQRYTPGTAELFNLMPGDRGRPISHLTNLLQYEEMVEDARRVVKTLVPIEREVRDTKGRWFLAQLRPYRTPDNRIEGVVLTFINVSELKETEASLRRNQEQLRRNEEQLRAEKEFGEKIVHTVREGLLVLEPSLRVDFANASFYEMFAVDEADTIGSYIYDLGNGQWNIPELRTLLEEILPKADVFNGYRVAHEFEDIGLRVMLLNARRLDHIERILLAIEDITDQERYEEDLRALNETLEERVARRTAQVETLARELTMAEHEERGRIAQILHDDLQQQLYALQVQLTFLRESAAGEAVLKEVDRMGEALETAIKTARQLSVDLSPPILEGEGLTEAVDWLATLMRERYRLRVAVQAEDSFTIPDLDRRVLLFQTVRELLFNVVKHARTPEATVRLQVIDGPDQARLYRIDVIDKGVGFNPQTVLGPEASPNGRGLLFIRQRLALIDGRLEVKGIPGDGTQVTILVPAHGETPPAPPPEPAPEEEA